MTKWTTLKFITGFFNNTLGRKTVHGTYRILEGDHCKLLVRATTMYGSPSGNELIAIDLSEANDKLVFWKSGFSRSFTYRMTRNIESDIESYQVLPELMLTGDEDNLLHSGIVDINATQVLIEIGDKPFLLHREIKKNVPQAVALGKGYSHANQVPKRVASIQEAQVQVKDPIGDRQLCKEWWAQEMPVGFTPSAFDPELVKVLSTALNPIDLGFSIDECNINKVSGSSHGSASIRSFIPKKKLIDAKPKTTRVQRWEEAVIKWEDASTKLLNRKPGTYKGLTVHSSRYVSLSNEDERVGTILVTTEGVYVMGEIHSKADWNMSDTLTQWFKLTQHANQINIPSRCI